MTLSSGRRRRHAANFVGSSSFNSLSAARLPAMQRCAGGQVSTLHCCEMSAELTFRNQVGEQIVVEQPPQMWVELVTYSAAAGGAARRLRNCASSASPAQNSEQKCCPADVRHTST